ncbi:MAG TPA: DUF1007 family protein [Thioalkalivibrio sp.]|nr:DUF1007 family protein [Thioalkalivibrio sp.]
MLFLLPLLLAAPPSHAHPHAWIDLRVTVVFDEAGRITALRQVWRIDPLYSMVLLEEMGADARGDSVDAGLADIGEGMIRNLAAHDYFTELHHAGRSLAGATVEDYGLSRRSGRLELAFTLRLPEPVDPQSGELIYGVFDPTYYIEILHDPDRPPALEGAPQACTLRIRAPRPDPAVVARAAALDVNQTGDPDLGRHFTEHGEVTCASAS